MGVEMQGDCPAKHKAKERGLLPAGFATPEDESHVPSYTDGPWKRCADNGPDTHVCSMYKNRPDGQVHRNGGRRGGQGRGPTETANSCGLPLGDGKVLEYESRDRYTTLNTQKPTELHTSKGYVSSSSIKLFSQMLGSLPIKTARKHKLME